MYGTLVFGDKVEVTEEKSFYVGAKGTVISEAPGYSVFLTEDKDGNPIPREMWKAYTFYLHQIKKYEAPRKSRKPARA